MEVVQLPMESAVLLGPGEDLSAVPVLADGGEVVGEVVDDDGGYGQRYYNVNRNDHQPTNPGPYVPPPPYLPPPHLTADGEDAPFLLNLGTHHGPFWPIVYIPQLGTIFIANEEGLVYENNVYGQQRLILPTANMGYIYPDYGIGEPDDQPFYFEGVAQPLQLLPAPGLHQAIEHPVRPSISFFGPTIAFGGHVSFRLPSKAGLFFPGRDTFGIALNHGYIAHDGPMDGPAGQ